MRSFTSRLLAFGIRTALPTALFTLGALTFLALAP